MACDAQTLINSAYSNGYAKLSERDLKMAIVASACAGGGGGGGAGQIVAYINDPNVELVTPTNQNLAAIAVSPGNPVYTWNTNTLNWI